MKNKEKEFTLHTKLKSIPEVNITIYKADEQSSSLSKKQARIEASVLNTSEEVGFLHACCIKIDGKYFLLAGPSQIGKSTYANKIVEHYGGEIIANDWIGIESSDDGQYYISDFNFKDKIVHEERCQLTGIFFLTEDDYFKRDAYSPNSSEFIDLMKSTFDTASEEELEKLLAFWLANKDQLPFCQVVPTRQTGIKDTTETFINLIERQDLDYSNIGIIGLGTLGQALAFHLGSNKSVKDVHMYNRTSEKSIGLAHDLNQAFPDEDEATYHSHSSPEEVFFESSIVFFCFRDIEIVKDNIHGERMNRVGTHMNVIDQYAEVIDKTKFKGNIMILSNPVDLLSNYLHKATQSLSHKLRTYQVYALGLELDLARAKYFSGLNNDEIKIFGNHSKDLELHTPLLTSEHEKLVHSVKNASKQIRQFVDRTVFAPVTAAIKSLTAIQNNSETSVGVLQQDSIVGHEIKFDQGLPSFSEGEEEFYKHLLEKNRKNFSDYI